MPLKGKEKGSAWNNLGIPLPAKPLVLEDGYVFPTDPSAETLESLGRLMFTITAWQSYVLTELAVAERTKVQLQARRILEDSSEEMDKEFYDVESGIKYLKRISSLYKTQVNCLSREISRRKLDLESGRT